MAVEAPNHALLNWFLGFTPPYIQWVLGILSLGVKIPGCEADHSSPFTFEFKNEWNCRFNSPYVPSSIAQGQISLLFRLLPLGISVFFKTIYRVIHDLWTLLQEVIS